MTEAREILLVGSVPLRPASSVFETVSRHLGGLIKRIPDGEQIGWMLAAFRSFLDHPDLERAGEVPLEAGGKIPIDTFRVRPGMSVRNLRLGPYGFARNAISSYAQFRALRERGIIFPGTKYQATLPGPGTSAFVIKMAPDDLLPVARAALLSEIDAMLREIPASDLVIQLDIAMEAEHEEYRRRPNAWDQPIHAVFDWSLDQMAESAAWLINHIPDEAEVGLHICSIWHHDTGAGQDNAVLVDAANAILRRATRPIHYVHIPIIPDHAESDFVHLANLERGSETKLHLGLINLADGLEGARRRIAAAKTAVSDFGVSMFCGLGRAAAPRIAPYSPVVPQLRRATPETIGDVLDLHRAVAELP